MPRVFHTISLGEGSLVVVIERQCLADFFCQQNLVVHEDWLTLPMRVRHQAVGRWLESGVQWMDSGRGGWRSTQIDSHQDLGYRRFVVHVARRLDH